MLQLKTIVECTTAAHTNLLLHKHKYNADYDKCVQIKWKRNEDMVAHEFHGKSFLFSTIDTPMMKTWAILKNFKIVFCMKRNKHFCECCAYNLFLAHATKAPNIETKLLSTKQKKIKSKKLAEKC